MKVIVLAGKDYGSFIMGHELNQAILDNSRWSWVKSGGPEWKLVRFDEIRWKLEKFGEI